jgi:D-alanyl-D-alanine carboxypeptidase/D-alanyl-D-alanine-endopeptidase (penicillin-binding protein 4)
MTRAQNSCKILLPERKPTVIQLLPLTITDTLQKCFAITLSTVVIAASSAAPAFCRHGHHRGNGHHQAKIKREDATKRKLHGVRQSIVEGFIIENENGDVLQSSNVDVLFNPASTLKLATSYMALCKFGPQGSFPTRAFINSPIDDKGVLEGNLYITGANPLFNSAQAQMLAKALADQGIHSVKGDLCLSPDFQLNISSSGKTAANQLHSIFNGHVRRSRHRRLAVSTVHIPIAGQAKIADPPSQCREIVFQDSPKLYEILKVMLCYSHNGLADSLGSKMGGPQAVSDFIANHLGLEKDEIKFSSSSGLGVNRITPKAMSRVLGALRDKLKDNKMTLADILPVAGIDPGTLERRFRATAERGSVIAKTGTLVDTDHGVSALAGEMKTQNDGTLLFVIFEQHGNVNYFRTRQEGLVAQVQHDHGGPTKFNYVQKALVCHLSH